MQPVPLAVRLEAAWRRVEIVRGPKLADVFAPVSERCRLFAERLRAFREVLGG